MPNSNIERINNFLKYWAKIIAQNPNISFSQEKLNNEIYSSLIRYDVSKKDSLITLNTDIYNNPKHESSFEHWINYYKNNDKINVFNSLNWSYFCQFISQDKKALAAQEHIKIYLPLDADHIREGAKIIFNYLTDNNISHVSKIGRDIRFDDIVIRVTKEEDAKKILAFEQNNSYLQEGLIKPNPFAFQQNGIALACDGSASYNDTIAHMIAMYLRECKEKNNLHTVNYQNFYHFVAQSYKNEFINKNSNSLQKVLNYKDIKEKTNYQHILALMLKSQDPSFTLEDYFNHYHHSIESKKEKEKDTTNLLLNTINVMTKKYGIEQGIKAVEAYILTGNSNYLTRDEGIRITVENSLLRENVLATMKKEKIGFTEYIRKIYPSEKKQISTKKENNEEEIEKLLIEVIKESAERFQTNGINQVNAYIMTNNPKFITRNNNMREKAIRAKLSEKIRNILKEKNISFEEYVTDIMRKNNVSHNDSQK